MNTLIKNPVIILQISIFVFVLSSGFGCVGNKSEIPKQKADDTPDILMQKFADIGYRVKSKEIKTPTDWEKEQFQMSGKKVYKIERLTALEGDRKDVYPRFEVVEEVFENEETAEARKKRIEEKPPDLSGPQEMYWMVGGFRHTNKVYFVSTDGSIFYEMMDEFIEKFHSVIKQ